MNTKDKYIPLNFIREKRLLTKRSLYNYSRVGNNSLFEILEQQAKYSSFIRNGCGEKSNVEMIKFCNFYFDNPRKINELYNEYTCALKKLNFNQS